VGWGAGFSEVSTGGGGACLPEQSGAGAIGVVGGLLAAKAGIPEMPAMAREPDITRATKTGSDHLNALCTY
jgi:hypothetical protein